MDVFVVIEEYNCEVHSVFCVCKTKDIANSIIEQKSKENPLYEYYYITKPFINEL